jgi:transposase
MDMAAAVSLRTDYSTDDLRQLAAKARDCNQVRRLLALAAIREGKDREEAARIGAMDRQTLRDWVHAFNRHGPEGLVNGKAPGPQPKLTAEQKTQFAAIVEAGPDIERDGVVRWRCADLKRVIKERFGVDLGEVTIGRLLKAQGFSHISARPLHPAQDGETLEAFKKTSLAMWKKR